MLPTVPWVQSAANRRERHFCPRGAQSMRSAPGSLQPTRRTISNPEMSPRQSSQTETIRKHISRQETAHTRSCHEDGLALRVPTMQSGQHWGTTASQPPAAQEAEFAPDSSRDGPQDRGQGNRCPALGMPPGPSKCSKHIRNYT